MRVCPVTAVMARITTITRTTVTDILPVRAEATWWQIIGVVG